MISLFLNTFRLLKLIVRSWRDEEIRGALVLCFLTLLSGTVFYSNVEGWHWMDALYFSTTTLATVGLGDLAPVTRIGRLFTVVYIFVGVGLFVALFAQFAAMLMSARKKQDMDDRS